jgi:hypothetical protein
MILQDFLPGLKYFFHLERHLKCSSVRAAILVVFQFENIFLYLSGIVYFSFNDTRMTRTVQICTDLIRDHP